ncbi:glycosyltransferase [Chryseobacterium sp. C-71]|uniref:glycosyltransferase n=1 Tax=Chryseobacterium sp. C-71 TaxID=2893882 RepID=UPI001E49263D|nr:glycosyltransferase [Chryseobacterium sp. C-71]UFH30854.1 glycosyltransferase [Chryseobacterium sp. C-71]
MKNKNILIAVPCFNEEKRLPLQDFVDYICNNEQVFCFINDGSTDRTIDVLTQLKTKFPDKVIVVDSKINLGKSNALQYGYQSVKNHDFTHFAYLDADLATPIEEIIRMSDYLDNQVEFVFGSRVNRIGSNIKRKLYRHLIGRFFATINSLLLRIPVYDTQCGAKIISKELSEEVFVRKFDTNWVFDVEIFFRILQFKKGSDINIYAKEIPLEVWTDIGVSSIKPKHYFGIFTDLFKIYRIYR